MVVPLDKVVVLSASFFLSPSFLLSFYYLAYGKRRRLGFQQEAGEHASLLPTLFFSVIAPGFGRL